MTETYQVRHRRYGVFQGVELFDRGAAMCYHPTADVPEMGICEFPDRAAAEKFVTWALQIDSLGYKPEELSIEPYDKLASDLLVHAGLHCITMEHWERLFNE